MTDRTDEDIADTLEAYEATNHADLYPVLIAPMTAFATVEQAEKLRDELERRLPGYTVIVAGGCSGSPTVIHAPENSPPTPLDLFGLSTQAQDKY